MDADVENCGIGLTNCVDEVRIVVTDTGTTFAKLAFLPHVGLPRRDILGHIALRAEKEIAGHVATAGGHVGVALSGTFQPHPVLAVRHPMAHFELQDFLLIPAPFGIGKLEYRHQYVRGLLRVVEHDVSAHGRDPGRQRYSQSPSGDVHLMDPLVAHVAIAVFPIPMPVVVETVFVEGTLGRGPQPEVVVDARRHRLIGKTPDGVAPFVADPLGHVDLTQPASVQKTRHALRTWIAALFGTILHQHLVFLGGFNQFAPLVHIVAARLFDRNMFAGLDRPDRGQCMPVVGRHDRNRVNLLVLEQLAQVRIGLGRPQVFIGKVALDDRREEIGIDIAQRRDLDIRQSLIRLDMALPHAVNTDHRHAHTIIRSRPRPVRSPQQRTSCCRHKLSTRHIQSPQRW